MTNSVYHRCPALSALLREQAHKRAEARAKLAAFILKVALTALTTCVFIALMMVLSDTAHAQSIDEYNAVCFDEQGEWLATDGCIASAERMGIEVDNILESVEKGCTRNEMFEDYSCKGPDYQGYDYVGEQDTLTEQPSIIEQAQEVSGQCASVDMTNTEVSEQDIDVLTQYFGFDAKEDNDDKLYSPECFEQGYVEWDWDSMVNNPCYDVLGDAEGNMWVEYIGCPALEADAPLTQQGTPAPSDWKEHVTPVQKKATDTIAESQRLLALTAYLEKPKSKSKK